MRPLRWLACTIALGLALAPNLAAAEWSLWPFGKSNEVEEEPTRQRPMTARADFWKADLDDEPKGPSIFTRMSNSTQRFFSSTKEALSFGKAKKPAPVNRVGTTTRTTKKKESSKSGSWFQPEEPEAPRTMNEWWKLKRIDPI